MTKKKSEITAHSSAAEYLTYVASIGENTDSMEMRYKDENIWLTQRMMAQLYDVSLPTINEHIKKIYSDGELIEEATIRKFRIVQTERTRQVKREVIHYNLQMIIAVGFKVNNDRAVRFRKWSGQIVKDYTIQGWTMDKERLKKEHQLKNKVETDNETQTDCTIVLFRKRFHEKKIKHVLYTKQEKILWKSGTYIQNTEKRQEKNTSEENKFRMDIIIWLYMCGYATGKGSI